MQLKSIYILIFVLFHYPSSLGAMDNGFHITYESFASSQDYYNFIYFELDARDIEMIKRISKRDLYDFMMISGCTGNFKHVPLLAEVCNLNLLFRDPYGKNIVEYAVEHQNFEILRYIMTCQNWRELILSRGHSILGLVAEGGNTVLMEFFLDIVDPNTGMRLFDVDGAYWFESPLHRAAMADRPDMVRFLISQGANPNRALYHENVMGSRGETPLHYAARAEAIGAMVALIESGAQLVPSGCKHSPYELARQNNRGFAIVTLQNYMRAQERLYGGMLLNQLITISSAA